jgi:hypothetical protein
MAGRILCEKILHERRLHSVVGRFTCPASQPAPLDFAAPLSEAQENRIAVNGARHLRLDHDCPISVFGTARHG